MLLLLETVMLPEMVSLLLAKVAQPPFAERAPVSSKTVPLAKVKVRFPGPRFRSSSASRPHPGNRCCRIRVWRLNWR